MRPENRRVAIAAAAVLTLLTFAVCGDEAGEKKAVSSTASEEAPERLLVEDLRFSEAMIPGDGVELFTKLHLPFGEGPFPAIVLVHGSGPDTYDFQYRQLSTFFAHHGVAALFFDKRGTGRSGGEYAETPDTMDYYARDVVAVVDYLAGRPEIDASRIGLWGHSQGGWIGPYASTLSEKVSFVINVSGPGVSPAHQICHQRTQELVRDGKIAAAEAGAARELRLVAYRYWTTGEGYEAAAARYAELAEAEWFPALGWPETLPTREELGAGSLAFMSKPALRFDPREVYRKIDVPVLVVYGADDWQIPVAESVEAIEEAIAHNPNAEVTIRLFEGTGHGIMTRGPDGRRFFKPGYPELMLEWLEESWSGRQAAPAPTSIDSSSTSSLPTQTSAR